MLSLDVLDVTRSISNVNKNDQNRGKYGSGTVTVAQSIKGNERYLIFHDNQGTKRLHAQIFNEKQIFGNAGRQNILCCDLYDTSGNQTILREYQILFRNSIHVVAILLYMYGGNTKLAEEWFDENGRFCPQVASKPPHAMAKDEEDMDVDNWDEDKNEVPVPQVPVRPPPLAREVAYETFGAHPEGESQEY